MNLEEWENLENLYAIYKYLSIDGQFVIRSLGDVNALKAALDFKASMQKLIDGAGVTAEQIEEVSEGIRRMAE